MEQIHVLNYKFYAKSVNIFHLIYLPRGERRKLTSKIQSLPVSVLGYFKNRLSFERLFPFISG